MELVMKIWSWVMSDGAVYLGVLWAISEALGAIPAIKANGVFQFISNGLLWLKDKVAKK